MFNREEITEFKEKCEGLDWNIYQYIPRENLDYALFANLFDNFLLEAPFGKSWVLASIIVDRGYLSLIKLVAEDIFDAAQEELYRNGASQMTIFNDPLDEKLKGYLLSNDEKIFGGQLRNFKELEPFAKDVATCLENTKDVNLIEQHDFLLAFLPPKQQVAIMQNYLTIAPDFYQDKCDNTMPTSEHFIQQFACSLSDNENACKMAVGTLLGHLKRVDIMNGFDVEEVDPKCRREPKYGLYRETLDGMDGDMENFVEMVAPPYVKPLDEFVG